MQQILHEYSTEKIGYPIIGKASEVFAQADPVTIDTDGFLKVATAGDKVIGYCLEAVTMAASNASVAKYKPQYILADDVIMAFTADQAATQTDIGAYADLVGTTGAIQMNLAAGSTGQFLVVGIGPLDNGTTTTEVAVMVAEPQQFAFAQS